MRRGQWLIIIGLGVLLVGALVVGISLLNAPNSTSVVIEQSPCQQSAEGECLRLPTISGANLDAQTAEFPRQLTGRLNLVVMPFDRDQQIAALDWLPILQDLALTDPTMTVYSLAALDATRIAPLFRTVIAQTMSAAVSEPALRANTYLFFVEEQARFIEALGIPHIEQMQVLVLNPAGEVLFAQAGAYSPEAETRLRDAVQDLR